MLKRMRILEEAGARFASEFVCVFGVVVVVGGALSVICAFSLTILLSAWGRRARALCE